MKGELHIGNGGAILVQQQLGSNQAYAERRAHPNHLSSTYQCAAESESEQVEKLAIVASMREVLCATPSAQSVKPLREHSFASIGNMI